MVHYILPPPRAFLQHCSISSSSTFLVKQLLKNFIFQKRLIFYFCSGEKKQLGSGHIHCLVNRVISSSVNLAENLELPFVILPHFKKILRPPIPFFKKRTYMSLLLGSRSTNVIFNRTHGAFYFQHPPLGATSCDCNKYIILLNLFSAGNIYLWSKVCFSIN